MAATDVSWRHHRKTKGAAVCEESRLIDNNNTITTCSYSFLKGKLGDDVHQDSPEPMEFHTFDEPKHSQGWLISSAVLILLLVGASWC